jgi:tRNA (adenine57-N1/adenine58-N1)-methyltransferase
LITARRLAPGTVLPQPVRRSSKTEYGDDDVELWTPGALGDAVKSDKRLRRVVRDARALAEESGIELTEPPPAEPPS